MLVPGYLVWNGGTVSGFTGASYGGCIIASGSASGGSVASLSGVKLSGCSATRGGGIALRPHSQLYLTNVEISDNTGTGLCSTAMGNPGLQGPAFVCMTLHRTARHPTTLTALCSTAPHGTALHGTFQVVESTSTAALEWSVTCLEPDS
jgi:hypothetical protein